MDASLPSPTVTVSTSNDPHPQHNETTGWLPQHVPTWTLGPQHPDYVRAAKSFLIGVPGRSEWVKLLEWWVTFESLSSSDPVSTLVIGVIILLTVSL